jgi:hypothetical protein
MLLSNFGLYEIICVFMTYNFFNLDERYNERRGRVANTPAWYSEGLEFKSRPGGLLF